MQDLLQPIRMILSVAAVVGLLSLNSAFAVQFPSAPRPGCDDLLEAPSTTLQGVIKIHPDGYGAFVSPTHDRALYYLPKEWLQGLTSGTKVELLLNQNEEPYALQATANAPDLPINRGALGSRRNQKALLGSQFLTSSDAERAIERFDLPRQFSESVKNEVKEVPNQILDADLRERQDLREVPFITIDGSTARDFDDAIYVEATDHGYRLMVAIADVSHYVKPGSALDQEAQRRGNSTYFSDGVVPMLPEELSNEICSLKPDVPRLVMVADMEFDHEGRRLSSKFYEAIIQSSARLTYGYAQEIAANPQLVHRKPFANSLFKAQQLAKVLRRQRVSSGALIVDLPQLVTTFADDGAPIDVFEYDRLDSQKLIEEMMLAANVAVGDFLESTDMPAVYRVHPAPSSEDLDFIEGVLQGFSPGVMVRRDSVHNDLSEALTDAQSLAPGNVVTKYVLRRLPKAVYSPESKGHFGLGSANYLHFTSPIRRYSDLVVHRFLKKALGIGSSAEWSDGSELDAVTAQINGTERNSAAATRWVNNVKRARLMANFIDQEFEGVIQSVEEERVHVSLIKYAVDGYFPVRDFDPDLGELVHGLEMLDAKRHYRLGEKVRVRVESVDIEKGRVHFKAVD